MVGVEEYIPEFSQDKTKLVTSLSTTPKNVGRIMGEYHQDLVL